MHQNTAAALKAGRARWLARMRLAKKQGVIAKFPNGRRPKGAPKPPSDRRVGVLRRGWNKIIEAQVDARMAKDAKLRVLPEYPDIDRAAVVRREPLLAPDPNANDSTPPATTPESSIATAGIAPRESPEEVEGPLAGEHDDGADAEQALELFEDLVGALFTAPGLSEGSGSLWEDVVMALPDELYDRLDDWVEKRLMETG